MKKVATTAAALIIGNELLSGKIVEGNLHALATTLRALGIALERVVMLGDDTTEIADEVRKLSAKYDLVVTSGGVGPTHDDLTLEAVAQAFGVQATVHPTIERLLKTTYRERFSENHLRMALVPEGAELVTTSEVLWPTVVMNNVWIMPGVPEIFRMKLAVLREHVRGPREFFSTAVYTQLEEADLKPHLDAIVELFPGVEIGSYPKWFDPTYKTKVTFDAGSQAEVEAAREAFERRLPQS